GLGESHAGIMVLSPDAKIGSPAAEYFNISSDYVFEIGLTPNRGDAASHYGVAIDLAAVLNCRANEIRYEAETKGIKELPESSGILNISVDVQDTDLCPRYSGITISGITVTESPDWLKNVLKSIGVRPINNIVDITNFVLHELGQPLHAFDAFKIKGNKVVVRKAKENESFVTLEGTERKLKSDDLMICNESEPMCIAGVFGGLESGVTEATTSVFLESAYFNPASIRKSSKNHGLKTDASFRFERGTDPEITVTALNRAANLILEIAGGQISGNLIDIYPTPVEPKKIAFTYPNAARLIGKTIDASIIKIILQSLHIKIEHEGNDALLLNVPARKSDVTREADVIEEIMRVYGYNNIEVPEKTKFSVSYRQEKDIYKTEEIIADFLSANGFTEIMSTSLTKEAYYSEEERKNMVSMLNPLSSDLALMRSNLLYSGLEAIAYNVNRKNADLKLYEIGRVYHKKEDANFKYAEQKQIMLFVTGRRFAENHAGQNNKSDYYTLKSFVEAILTRFSITNYTIEETSSSEYDYVIEYKSGKKLYASIAKVNKATAKKCDVNQEVFVAT
ncbi:MAG: phenylalanine--tRNA ligase subunit beta, partial [Bacteroidia bacterium]